MIECDVAIIGGGPAGSTVGTMLRKYNPDVTVAIFEAEEFPRDHVGESQLPVINHMLHEMGVWDKVEAADFPVKVGATFRWGMERDDELFYFNFIQEEFESRPRPGKFQGQRIATAFQVDRSIYDKILLDHSESLGCKVYGKTHVRKVEHEGDRIDHLLLEPAEEGGEPTVVKAKYYVDATGGSALIRKTMGVEVESPTSLRNIAIWDYWQNAEWAEKVGVGGTFIQIMSLGWGWLWFIPLGPTRTSLGLVTSAEYYKKSGLSTEELYLKGISEEARISPLVKNATREGKLQATRDWSFIADRLTGDNWFLVGDACGFADPILSAGMSLAHMSGRRVAFSLLELLKDDSDADWIKSQYNSIHRKNIGNHIRFADYWYSVNSKFTDLQEYCSQIAKDAGLNLDANAAFYWLGTGGFADEISGVPFAGSYRISAMKDFTARFSGMPGSWDVQENNIFELDLEGAKQETVAVYDKGHVLKVPCWVRDGKTLPMHLMYGVVYNALKHEKEILFLAERFLFEANKVRLPTTMDTSQYCTETLEAMVTEGWVKASYDPNLPLLRDYGKSMK
jgi:flavin-dependent dehydrogenase